MRIANNKKLPVARKKMQTKITHNKCNQKNRKRDTNKSVDHKIGEQIYK